MWKAFSWTRRDTYTLVENTFGLRLLAVSGFLWFDGLARSIKSAFPERKIITRVAPDWLIKLLGLFDRQIRQIVPMLGVRFDVSNKRAKSLLSVEFKNPGQSAIDSAKYLIDHKVV